MQYVSHIPSTLRPLPRFSARGGRRRPIATLLGCESLEQRHLLSADFAWWEQPRHNALLPADVDGDGYVAPLDALGLLNALSFTSAMRGNVAADTERATWYAPPGMDRSSKHANLHDTLDDATLDVDTLADAVLWESVTMDYDVNDDGVLSNDDWSGVMEALSLANTALANTALANTAATTVAVSNSLLSNPVALAMHASQDSADPCAAAPPTVSVTGGTSDEGSIFAPTLSFGGACLLEYKIDWGDGDTKTYTVVDPFDTLHVYANEGDYTMKVTLYNQAGASATASDIVHVNNVAPTANPDEYTINENDYSFNENVVANDRDVGKNDYLELFNIDTTQTKGIVTHGGWGWINYQPYATASCLAEGETATDSFSYTIRDEAGGTSTTTVTIHLVGRRNVYSLHYVASSAAEEGPTAASVLFRLVPTPTCHPVTLSYGQIPPAAPYQVAADQAAAATDVAASWGLVNFPAGVADVEVKILPVDDKIIERDEWFFIKAHSDVTPDYRLFDMSDFTFFKIRDNEWRFVSQNSTAAHSLGPTTVQAFSSVLPPFTSYLSANVNYSGVFNPNIGTTQHSTAITDATVNAKLTHFFSADRSHHEAGTTFVCDSQTGDIWHHEVVDRGHPQDGPLASATELIFGIDDAGDDEARVVVSLKTRVVAKGSITTNKKGTAQIGLSFGAPGKGSASGGVELSESVSYDGGDAMGESGGHVFFCRRGEAPRE